jgi:para-aminobenzoate synthetase/4-amino-4-deoxychorismate lyase
MVELRMPDPLHGVFSTTLVVDGHPVDLEAHLARLRDSVRALYGVRLPASARALAREQAQGLALGRLRLTATPADGGTARLEASAESLERAAILPGWTGALDLRTVVLDRWPGAHMWADRRLLEALDAQAAPAGALLVAPDGSVRETTRGNVFALGADGVLRTPPLDGSILPGITRARVLALAAAAGVVAREERLSVAQLRAAREAFATGALRGIEPIRSMDGAAVGPERSEALAAALARELGRGWLGANTCLSG